MEKNNFSTGFSIKADFFKGGSFTVNLSPLEISHKVFIPGHRFIPFLNPAVRPWNVKITDNEGKDLSRKTVSANPEALKPFYSLYGEENFLFLLIDDRHENSGIILNGTDVSYKLSATVYDLSRMLPDSDTKTQVMQKSALVFKIDNWEKGIYKVSPHIPDTKNMDTAEWVDTLENGFKTVFEKNKKLQMVADVMSDAFLYGGKALLENPVLSLEEFFDISEISDIADMISVQKEDPEIAEQKRFVREKTLSLIKTLTSWLENSSSDEQIILEKQVLVTKRTLIAVLEELNNPFISEEMIKTMLQVISESSQLVSKIR